MKVTFMKPRLQIWSRFIVIVILFRLSVVSRGEQICCLLQHLTPLSRLCCACPTPDSFRQFSEHSRTLQIVSQPKRYKTWTLLLLLLCFSDYFFSEINRCSSCFHVRCVMVEFSHIHSDIKELAHPKPCHNPAFSAMWSSTRLMEICLFFIHIWSHVTFCEKPFHSKGHKKCIKFCLRISHCTQTK